MPEMGKEICLTELEVKLMAVFVREKVFGDLEIANILRDLSHKLIKNYALGDK